jgi:hypothetical protein
MRALIAAAVVVALAACASPTASIEADPRRAAEPSRNVAMELERDPNAKAPSAAPALDSDALGSRALTRELQGDHAGALEDLRAAIAKETDPERLLGLRNLLLLLENPRDQRDPDVRGDPPR